MSEKPWQFQPGNKASKGGVRGPRFTTRLLKYIKQHGHKDDITTAWLGAALGDEKLLKGRKPNFQFFKELLDRADGRIPDVEPHMPVSMEVLGELEGIVGSGDAPKAGQSDQGVSEQSEPIQ